MKKVKEGQKEKPCILLHTPTQFPHELGAKNRQELCTKFGAQLLLELLRETLRVPPAQDT